MIKDHVYTCVHLSETLWVIGTPMVIHVHFSLYFLPFVNVYGEHIFFPKMHKNIKSVIPKEYQLQHMSSVSAVRGYFLSISFNYRERGREKGFS